MIKVGQEHLNQIRIHAERLYPEECCGLLLGTISTGEKILTQVWETENSWGEDDAWSFQEIESTATRGASKGNRFSIAPQVMLQVQKEARDRHLAIIGIYHSHPDCPAVPSQFDRAIAWQEYSYIIVSVQQGRAEDIRSWTLDDKHQFQPEEIVKQL